MVASGNKTGRRVLIAATVILIVIHFAALTTIMCARVAAFDTPTYDMGLFTQMFHYMLRTGRALTTLERDMLLSHFQVHMSPIYYLYLPFFALFPSAYTLQILQTFTVLLALYPLSLILRRYTSLSLPWRAAIYLMYVFAPGITGSSFYDLHENCFLPLCLFFLLEGQLANSKRKVFFWTVLTLLIKEDAMIYVFFIGAYSLFCLQGRNFSRCSGKLSVRIYTSGWQTLRQEWWRLLLNVILPLVYFSAVVYYLNHYGQGAMVNRFDNLLLPGQHGLVQAAFNLILHPFFIIEQIFTSAKIRYLTAVLAAMAFLPLWQYRLANYCLLCPFIVMNLLSNYQYQHSLVFQYNYGTGALLIYLTAVSLEAILLHGRDNRGSQDSRDIRRTILSLLVCLGLFSAFLTTSSLLRHHAASLHVYNSARDKYQTLARTLSSLPRDKKILADTLLTTALADVPELYDLEYHRSGLPDRTIDYVVAFRNGENETVIAYKKEGYIENDYSNRYLIVLQKNA